MDHFTVDKSFYDLSSSDLKDLWDSDIESSLPEFKMSDDDWNCEGMVTVKPHVILNDRLMSDAILEDTPIKVEHSYCSQSSPSMPQIKDESEDECLMSTMPTKSSECVISPSPAPNVIFKSEPMSEPTSPASSCPPSPTPSLTSSPTVKSITIHTEVRKTLTPQATPLTNTVTKSRILKRKPINSPSRIIKIEPALPSGFPLPPTPPSSTSSDSEGNISPTHPPSPTRRMFLSVGSAASSRQPIHTPLISSQPKGSTGTLLLTEEEKRTLLAEGYPIPVRLPLTKAEEKSLKKIRRKIKNKISAQESRRKKKEYMDALERKVQHLSTENTEFAKKINSLEDINSSLMAQVSQMQAIIARYQSEPKSILLQK